MALSLLGTHDNVDARAHMANPAMGIPSGQSSAALKQIIIERVASRLQFEHRHNLVCQISKQAGRQAGSAIA